MLSLAFARGWELTVLTVRLSLVAVDDNGASVAVDDDKGAVSRSKRSRGRRWSALGTLRTCSAAA